MGIIITHPPIAVPAKVQRSNYNGDNHLVTLVGALKAIDGLGSSLGGKIARFSSADTADLFALSDYFAAMMATPDGPTLLSAIGAVPTIGGTMTGPLAMSAQRITGLGAPSASTDAATKAYVDALATLVSGALVFKGAWDASAGTFPGSGAAPIGSFYKVSVAGTVGGQPFSIGDDLYAVANNASASTYANNWLVIQGSITLAEVQSAVGFTFGSLASLSSITASLISDASANGRSLIQSNYAGMRTLLGLAAVATSGAYGDLSGTPSLGSLAALSSITASLISDASANGRSLITAANYAAMKVLLSLAVADVSGAAPLASPAFTGSPVAPTQSGSDNSTKIATTAMVQSALAGVGGLSAASNSDMWAETSATKAVTPSSVGSAKQWVALTDAATILVDSTTGRNFKLASMGGNRTLGFPSGTLVPGDEYLFWIKQDATGSRTLATASGYVWDGDFAIPIGTTASKGSLLSGVVLNATQILIQLIAVNFTAT